MDEDIFAFDSQYQELLNEDIENEELHQTLTENNENQIDIDLLSICFNCKSESATNFEENIFRKDLENLFSHNSVALPDNEIELFNYEFDTDYGNYDILIQMARANFQQLSMSILDSYDQHMNRNFQTMRSDVTKLMVILRCNYQNLNENHLKMLRIMLGTFNSMPNFSLAHMSFTDGNASVSANYHMLHLMLECRWLYLTIIYKIDYFNGQIGSENSEVSCEIKLLMFDLIMLSVAKYQKSNSANLVFTSPFVCSCVKDLWKLLYIFTEKLSDQYLEFWNLLTEALNEIANGKSSYEKFPSKRILLRSSQFSTCKDHDQFAIWMVTSLIKIMEIKDPTSRKQCYEFYENLIRKYLKVDQSEENMRVLVMTLADVLLNSFQPKSEILMILWEYYQRKINSPFLIAGQTINSMAVSSITAFSYLEQIKTQQNSPISKLNLNSSSFNMFVYILGKMTQRFAEDGQKIQVQKVFSRIYTKFPPNKLQQLNEMGIHNFMRLLITLSLSSPLADVGHKVTDTLLQIPMEKPNHQQQVMKGHLAMLILYNENSLNLSTYVTKIMNKINGIIQKSSTATGILKILSESLSLILLKNLNDYEGILENGEELLLDSWIVNYFQSSSSSEQDRLYESLTKIIQKVNELHNSSIVTAKIDILREKLFSILLPYVKQVFGKIESVWLPEMVANLCLLANSSKSDPQKFQNLFKTFMDTNSTNLEQSMKFLTIILRNCDNKESLDITAIIQNWIKFSVLLSGSNNELKELTQQIASLKDFQFLCETAALKTDEFLNSKERLCSFVSDIGRKYSASSNQQKFQIIEKVHGYLSFFEKWSLPYLQQQQQQVVSQKPVSVDESVMRIYSFIAITYLHCSELIYVRSKSSCFFNVANAHFILPSNLMVGQSPPRSVIVSMHRIWPLVLDGISRLNYKCDQHVAKVLNDIIVKWAPLMKISNNSKFVAKPFLNISNLKNFELIELFWGKLAKSYVALQPGRKSNVHSSLILTMFEEVLHVVETDVTRLLAVWKNVLQQVIEGAMLLDELEPTQKTCYSLLERFIKNRNFETASRMKELLIENLKQISESSLSYHSALYFRFLTKLAKINAGVINSFLPHLMTQIQKVEQLRGSGRDVKLRNFYDQLQSQCKGVRV